MRTVMGFVIAGGGSMVVVETDARSGARRAYLCEIVGYGATSDGADMVAPSGEGAVRCMQMAMHGVDTPIDYLNSHGTSTPVGDVKELGCNPWKCLAITARQFLQPKAMTDTRWVPQACRKRYLLSADAGARFYRASISIEELDMSRLRGLNIVTETFERELTTVMSNASVLAAPTPRWCANG